VTLPGREGTRVNERHHEVVVMPDRRTTALTLSYPALTREHWSRFAAAVALLIGSTADVATTSTILARGGAELNPLAGALMSAGMLEWVKVLVPTVVGVAALVLPGSRPWVARALWTVAALQAVVVFANLVTLSRL
jgi:hypothetical protein